MKSLSNGSLFYFIYKNPLDIGEFYDYAILINENTVLWADGVIGSINIEVDVGLWLQKSAAYYLKIITV